MLRDGPLGAASQDPYPGAPACHSLTTLAALLIHSFLFSDYAIDICEFKFHSRLSAAPCRGSARPHHSRRGSGHKK